MLVLRQLCNSRAYSCFCSRWWENILAMLCIHDCTAALPISQSVSQSKSSEHQQHLFFSTSRLQRLLLVRSQLGFGVEFILSGFLHNLRQPDIRK